MLCPFRHLFPCFRTSPVRPAFAQPSRSTTSECSHHGYAVRQLGVPLIGQGDQGALLQSKTCTTTLDGRASLQSEQRRLAALARRRYTELAISPADDLLQRQESLCVNPLALIRAELLESWMLQVPKGRQAMNSNYWAVSRWCHHLAHRSVRLACNHNSKCDHHRRLQARSNL